MNGIHIDNDIMMSRSKVAGGCEEMRYSGIFFACKDERALVKSCTNVLSQGYGVG